MNNSGNWQVILTSLIGLGLLTLAFSAPVTSSQHDRMKLRKNIELHLGMETYRVSKALRTKMNEYDIHDASDSYFNLMQCCGYTSYLQSISGWRKLNKAEIVLHTKQLAQVVIDLGKVPSLDSVIIRNLDNTLEAMKRVDAAYKIDVGSRLASALGRCKRGFDYDARITLNYLYSAFEMLKYLLEQGV